MLEVTVPGRIDQDAIDLARPEHVNHLDLFFKGVVGRRKQRAVALCRERNFYCLGGLRQRRVEDIGQHQAYRPSFAADQQLAIWLGT